MTNQTTITQTIRQLPYAALYISEHNPRTEVTDEATIALAENIKVNGLIHNLAAYAANDDDLFGVVAGGRRYRALGLLQDDPRFQTVPVLVTDDEETAKLWATSENAQREPLSITEEIRDFGKMAKHGKGAAEIAIAYGVTEAHVNRRVALAGLADPILDALQNQEISLTQTAAFTISEDPDLSLQVLEQVKEHNKRYHANMTEHQIKAALKPNAVNAATDRRAKFVGLDAYKEAGGKVSGDLFADIDLCEDVALLETLFVEKLQDATEAYVADHGVKWARHIEDAFAYTDYGDQNGYGRVYRIEVDLTEAEEARYDELGDWDRDNTDDEQAELEAMRSKMRGDYSDEQKAISGAILYVTTQGNINVIDGLVDPEDRAEAEESGIIAKSHHKPATPKNPISDKLRGDLNRIQTGARQNAMLDDPKLALHLLAFQLTDLMVYRTAYGLRKDLVPNVPETETGYVLDKRLTTPVTAAEQDNLADAFAAFRKRGDKQIMDILNRHLIAQLSVGDASLGAMIDQITKKQTRDTFTPTAENFFKRVSGPYLETLWCDLLGLDADDPTAKTFAKLKKGDKVNAMEKLFADPSTLEAHKVTDEQAARIAAWLPDGMI